MPLIEKDYYTSLEALLLIKEALPDEDPEQNLLDVLRNGQLNAWIFDQESQKPVPVSAANWQGDLQSMGRELVCFPTESRGYLGHVTGEVRVDKSQLDSLLAASSPLGNQSRKDGKRPQAERMAVTKHRNEELQEAANEILSDAQEGKSLTKREVAQRLLGRDDPKDLLRDQRAKHGGLLKEESIIRLIKMPEFLPNKQPRKKDKPR